MFWFFIVFFEKCWEIFMYCDIINFIDVNWIFFSVNNCYVFWYNWFIY